MTSKLVAAGSKRQNASSIPLLVGLVLVLSFFAISAGVAYFNIRTLQEMTGRVSHTHEVIAALKDVFSMMKDAETGQRGYVLTGDEKYLQPYTAALSGIEQRMGDLERLVRDNAEQQARLPEVKTQIELKKKELAETIAVRRAQGFEAARAIVLTDRGKAAMDALRANLQNMEQEERQLRHDRLDDTGAAFRAAVQSGFVTALLGALLAVIVFLLQRRADQARWRQDWLQSGQAQLSSKLIGEQRLGSLGENALVFLCEYLGAQAGALYIEGGGNFRRLATYAVPSEASLPEHFARGEGLLGQAVKDARPFLVKDVPPGYLAIGSSFGSGSPRHLLIAPSLVEGNVNAVLELGFFHPVPEATIELMIRTAEAIGVAVHSAKARTRIEELLEETQRQSEEVQAQSEELRVSNEELEEQSQALQRTQAQLENQQAELEQTNLQLEAQTRMLELQKEDLIQAKLGLETQAQVVEQASRYKSAFLANMSHELRTPLNSSLILSQLLAENRGGNLTEEQIKYARTIQSSGNDLLALINDVLDLSKIEAGRMDLMPKPIAVADLLETLRRQFEPIAANKGIDLKLTLTPSCPQVIETDPQRLEQVLRNLISNALKFTEKGEVSMQVSGLAPDRVSFAVRDTGIGIDPSHLRLIFEPFCQADGTTSRKYGGTGLGLSISRELARLLGGEIELTSQVGRGSVFTVVLPEVLNAVSEPARLEPAATSFAPLAAPAPALPTRPASARKAAAAVTDDRSRLSGSEQVILVIEDDPKFAEILVNLAHEQNFKCLVTTSAHEALELARQHVPSAVVLDVGLPDGSGLFVLDRLKHDARTRHIPVHVVSGSDYTEKAMAMGAAGYMLKPVPREKLADAFQELERKLTHRLRRVLVVEDDPVQLGALCSLLSSREVEAVGAQDAAGCLQQLKGDTFDCMVLDLSLPDASGFTLLEKISGDESYPFPPVIIYTGRELSADEEQRLRRYSKSIIVKGAKSPERLLDEVALFLHQVVAELPAEQQKMIEKARSREAALEGRRILLAEDDVRNIFALTSLLEPLGLTLEIARNGREAVEALERTRNSQPPIDLVLMDIMMPEMDGLTAMRTIRQKPEWQKLPIIALTAKAMPADQQQCLEAGANDYLAKPLDVEKLLSLVRVWMPR